MSAEPASNPPKTKYRGRKFTDEERSRGGKAAAKVVWDRYHAAQEAEEAGAGKKGNAFKAPGARLIAPKSPSAHPHRALEERDAARAQLPGVWDDDKRTWRHRLREIETQVVEPEEESDGHSLVLPSDDVDGVET